MNHTARRDRCRTMARHSTIFFFLFLLFTFLCTDLTNVNAKPVLAPKRAKLQEIRQLRLFSGAMTTYRRTSPSPQLVCLEGPCKFAPSIATCHNAGYINGNVKWLCEADLPKGIQLDRIQVICEGYQYPEDEYVLEGSCGLEYTLRSTQPISQDTILSTLYQYPVFRFVIGLFIVCLFIGIVQEFRRHYSTTHQSMSDLLNAPLQQSQAQPQRKPK